MANWTPRLMDCLYGCRNCGTERIVETAKMIIASVKHFLETHGKKATIMSNATSMSTVGRTATHERSETDTSWHNVGEDERAISCLAGLGLMLYGLRRGSWAGAASFLTGMSLLHRGWSGYCVSYDQLGISTATDHHQQPGVQPNMVGK